MSPSSPALPPCPHARRPAPPFSAPMASPSSVTPPSGVTVMDAASHTHTHTHRPPQRDRLPSSMNSLGLSLRCLRRFRLPQSGSESDCGGQDPICVPPLSPCWAPFCTLFCRVCVLTNGAENCQNIHSCQFCKKKQQPKCVLRVNVTCADEITSYYTLSFAYLRRHQSPNTLKTDVWVY